MQRRALYNLLHLPQEKQEFIENLEPWQIEDYRKHSDSQLFSSIKKLGIHVPGVEGLTQLAEQFDSPDDLVDAIGSDLDEKIQDQLYLNVFELWRRHLPEKRCPSVFCDELDFQIRSYLENPDGNQEEIEDILNYFMQILESHLDEGADPGAIFNTFQSYCAINLESFLFQYILREIEENGDYEYAYDLIEGFYPYLNEPLWFNYLLARAQMLDNPKEGTEVLAQVIQHVDSLQLAEEILLYLAKERNHPLFCSLAIKIMELITVEEEFQEFLECARLHFQQMELHEPAKKLEVILEKREANDLEKALSPRDSGVKETLALIAQWNHVL